MGGGDRGRMQGTRVFMEHLCGSSLSGPTTGQGNPFAGHWYSLILLVPVRGCFLATLVNLAMVAHLAKTGFPTQGSVTPKTYHPFTYLVLREIQGPWNCSPLLGVPLLVRQSHFRVWSWRSLHTLAFPSLSDFHW